MILKSKVSLGCMIQECLYESLIFKGVPRHGIKGSSTPRYFVPFYVVKRGTIAYQN
jgi:hypothetical protein